MIDFNYTETRNRLIASAEYTKAASIMRLFRLLF